MSCIFTNTIKTLALGLILAASVHSASATAVVHTYVSGAGSDSNPCSRTSPCATFQVALANTVPGGVITALDAGDYGAVTIAKAVTIDGTGAQASIVTNTSADTITINGAPSDTIILRHLSLTGIGVSTHSSVTLNSGNLVVDDCTISGFNTYGLLLSGSGTAVVENTKITECNEGIAGYSSGLLSLRTVTLQDNQYGLDAEGGPVDISASLITQNSNIGLYAYSGGSGVTLAASACMISGNGTAVYADSNSTIRLTNNDILNNTTGIDTENTGGTTLGIVASTGDNRKAGNITSGNVTSGKVIAQQ